MKKTGITALIFACALPALAQTESSSIGFLKTRVSTTERLAFPAGTPQGTEVYDNVTKSFWMWDGTKWVETITSIKADTTNDGWKNVSGQLQLAYQANGTTARPDTAAFVINDSGNVGIGTSAPASLLSLRQTATGSSSSSAGPLRAENMSTGSYVRMAEFYAPNNTSAGNGSQLIFGTSNSTGNATEWRFRYDASNSNNNRGEFAFFGTANPVMSYLKSGSVGIGTTAPQSKLHINGSTTQQTSGETLLTLQAAYDSGTLGSGGSIKFTNNRTTADAAAIVTRTTGTGAVAMGLQTGYGTGTLQDRITIASTGNVGINATAPAAKLHTNGSLRFQSLPASTTDTKLLTINASEDVATRNVADFFPKVIAGCNGTDILTSNVQINATSTNTSVLADLYTVDFTLERESILDVASVISVLTYDASGSNNDNGFAKGYKTVTELYPNGSTTLIRNSTASTSYTNHSVSPSYAGTWYINNSFKHRLAAGSYTLKVRGWVSISASDTEGARGNYGQGRDTVDIIALPVN